MHAVNPNLLQASIKKLPIFRWGLILIIASSVYAGEIRTDSLYANALDRYWKMHIYHPGSVFAPPESGYPILFLLHGSGGAEDDWDRAVPLFDKMIADGNIAPFIGVAVGTGTSWWVNGREQFEKAYVRDLIPFIEANYPVTRSREGHALAGFSMGGYGALRYALEYPEYFSSTILLSPALYSEQPPEGSSAISSGSFGKPFDPELWKHRNYPNQIQSYLKKDLPVHIFIGAGDDDWNHTEGQVYNMEVQSVKLYSTFHRKHDQPAELRIVNGGHNWNLWLPLLEEALIDLHKHSPEFAPGGKNAKE